MQTARLTCSTSERKGTLSAVNGATVHRTRWETAYSSVDWDYPPSPAVYYNTLLARGASHSRFLRIAYSSARERSNVSAPLLTPWDSPTSPAHLTASPPSPSLTRKQLPPVSCSLSRPCASASPRSTNPPSHTLKRRKPHWPKPPHYHASLLRSPLSRRKGLFRAVLPPNKAVDFFRWDILLSAGISLSAPRQERDPTRTGGVDACTSLHVAEVVLEPYEAAAGFCGWHGLGLGITPSMQGMYDECEVDECCWGKDTELWRPIAKHDGAGKVRSTDVQREIDEATVDEGRERWARLAEELVGPPGFALRWMVEGGKSDNATAPLGPVLKDRVAFSISSYEEVRPDIGSSPFRPPRPTPAPDEKKQLRPSSSTASIPGSASGSKPDFKPDSPSAWWYAPSQHCGPPQTSHLPSLRHPHPPHVQYVPPPLQISPYFPGGRVASAQGHGFWYGAQPTGAPPVNRDSNLAKSLPAHHSFVTPVTPRPIHSLHFPWHPTKSSLGRDSDDSGHDCDKETETDHGYESATTTTDSDPPPHTPINAATTAHCIEARLLGDEIVTEHGVTTVKIGLSDPTTPVKPLGRFPGSPSASSSSSDLERTGHVSSKAAVVFPSLNGSFRQGSLSQVPASSSNLETSAQMAPAGGVPTSLTSPLSTREGYSDGDNSTTEHGRGGLEPFPCTGLQDSPTFTLSLSSPPPTSPRPGLRRDSQGFWEPVTPISPCSSSSSSLLPLSPLEGGESPTTGRTGERKGPASREVSESPETSGTFPTKSRSTSPGPQRATSVDSTCSSSSRHTTFSSPTTTPASASVFGGSYPSSPSSSNNPFLVPPNSTTLLPAFLSTANGKRKKASRTREIVDQLRSSSIDGGKGMDNLGWLASPSANGESDGVLEKASSGSNHLGGNHVARGQPSPSSPTKPRSDSTSWSGSESGKSHGQTSGSGTFESSSGSEGKRNGVPTGSEPSTTSKTAATAPRTVTPFPILSVSPTSSSNTMMAHRNPNGGTVIAPLHGGDGSKLNVTVSTSPNARSQLLPDSPNGTIMQSSHHPPLSPSHPTAHPPAVLGPPMFAIAPYPHPMCVPYAPYPLAPPHQGQQGQGTWLAVYPGRPVHLPVHPLPAQSPITGVSGMRHVSW